MNVDAPLLVKNRHTCFFCDFDWPPGAVGVQLSAMLRKVFRDLLSGFRFRSLEKILECDAVVNQTPPAMRNALCRDFDWESSEHAVRTTQEQRNLLLQYTGYTHAWQLINPPRTNLSHNRQTRSHELRLIPPPAVVIIKTPQLWLYIHTSLCLRHI